MQRGVEEDGVDVTLADGGVQLGERNAGAWIGPDGHGLHAEALNDLQDAVVGRAFDGDAGAGRDGSGQGQFHGHAVAGGDEDVIGAAGHAARQHERGDVTAQAG